LQHSVKFFFFFYHLYKTVEIENNPKDRALHLACAGFLAMSACVYPDICFTVFQEIETISVQISTMPKGKDQVILVS